MGDISTPPQVLLVLCPSTAVSSSNVEAGPAPRRGQGQFYVSGVKGGSMRGQGRLKAGSRAARGGGQGRLEAGSRAARGGIKGGSRRGQGRLEAGSRAARGGGQGRLEAGSRAGREY